MLATWDAVTRLDRMVDDVMGSMLGTATNSRSFDLAVDVRSTDDEVVFSCDVPGVKSEDLDITLENGVLTIKGSRNYEAGGKEQVMLGRSYGQFARSYTLPNYLDYEKLSADLADGVLTIRIPKHQKAKPIKISIGTSPGEREQKQLTE
jgi:HSP20 family protein